MKKISTLFLMALMMSVSVFARQMQYDVSAGETYLHERVTDQEIVQTIMGQDQVINNLNSSSELFEVTEVTDEVITFKSTTVTYKNETTSIQGTQVFDSEGTGPSDIVAKAMTGKSYGFRMSPAGEILEITGLEDMRAAVKEELAGTQFAQLAEQLTAELYEESLSYSLSGLFDIYADKSATEWTKIRSTVLNGVPSDLNVNYSWAGDETISMDSDITVQGEIEQMGQTMQMNLSGVQNGTIEINPSNNMPVKSETSGDLAGFVAVQGMEIPVSFTTKSTSTLTKQ